MLEVKDRFVDCINRFRGEECWAIVAGAGTGSHLSLHIGKHIKREKPIPNPNFDSQVQLFRGELSIFVMNCAWRLDGPNSVLCSWKSDSSARGDMISGLENIKGKRVIEIVTNFPQYDLQIRFHGDIRLSLFCDCIYDEDGDDYNIITSTDIFVVGPKQKLSHKKNSDIP